MSVSGIINPADGKIYTELYNGGGGYNLGEVLSFGNNASNPTTGLPQDATDFDTLGCISIQTGKVYQGNNTQLEIGEAGDILKLVGAITKGSILVGSGVETKELPVGANGLVLKANSSATYGVEWGTDASGGTVMAVNAGDNIIVSGTIAQPIVNVSNPIFVQKVNAPNTTNLTLQSSNGGEQSNLIMNAINATTGITTQSSLGADDSIGGNGGSVKVMLTDPAVSSTSVLGQVLSTTATHETKWLNNVITSDYASNLVQSEANQTKLRCEVIDTANQTNSVREDITLAGVMLDTHTGTQLGTNIVAQRIEQVGYTLGCNQVLQYTNPASIQATQTQQTSILGATYQGITEDFPFGALHKGAYGFSATNIQGEVSTLYEDQTIGAVYQGTGSMICNAGGSTTTITSANVSTGQSKLLRLETPASGDALIEHIAFGGSNLQISTNQNLSISADNIDLDATGRLVLPSLASGDYLDYNAGSLKIVNDSVAGSANPLLVLQNNNNTAGATTFETYKNDQPTSTGGDNIASWSATCNTNVGKTEISRVNHIAYGTGASNNDGGISLACKVNSSITNFLICNGGANNAIGSGEVQVFKPITSVSPNNLNLICPTAGGTAKIQSVSNIELEATGDNLTTISGANTTISTTGVGSQIEFKPEATAGKIVFTGASLQSGSSSGNSGEHLVIYLNGVKYHIALQTP
ncbi:collagen-like protein [Essdubovirus chlorellae]|nr:collagen-like protein [Chlorella virophage]